MKKTTQNYSHIYNLMKKSTIFEKMKLHDIHSLPIFTPKTCHNYLYLFLIMWPLVFSSTAHAQQRRVKLPSELKEISGIVALPDHTIWALNDGGNQPVLFHFDPQHKKITERHLLPVSNRDWEDLQMDQNGNLWIGDIGNNGNRRKDLCFFRFNPVSLQIDSVFFSFPDQRAFPPSGDAERNFDCEAFVWYNDTLHLFTKSRFAGRHFTKHYAVPALPGNWQAQLRDSLFLPKRVVSGAGVSADGKTLALTAYYVKKRIWGLPYTRASVFFITGFKDTHFLRGEVQTKRLPKFLIARQFESITQFSDDIWLAANEGILWQKPGLWKVLRKP
jgi:hypothetical protein